MQGGRQDSRRNGARATDARRAATPVVADASVLLKSFSAHEERHEEQALAVMEAWDARRLDFVAPQLLYLESSSSPREVELRPRGHRRRRDGAAKLGIETPDPELERIADWTDLGLTAYDAAHVAVAEAAGTPLTDDDQIVELAPEVVVALAAFEPPA